MRRRIAALGAVASLLLGACSGPSPSAPSPFGPISSPSTGPTPSAAAVASGEPSAAPSGSGATIPELARRLHDTVRVDAILADLRSLEQLTVAAGGSRAAGTPGEAAAVDFVATELQRAGLQVTRHEVPLPVFRETGPGALEIRSSPTLAFKPTADFKAHYFSPSGDVTARVVALGFDPKAAPGSTGGVGCDAADWARFPSGSIALVQPGPCRARQVVLHAQEAGAVAVVRSYPGWVSGRVLRPTLLDPSGLRIPVVAVTQAVGLAIDEAARQGRSVRVAVETATTMGHGVDLFAETPAGDPAHVVMLGAHLDSVIDGPGINDDGSGAMTVLEIARRLGALSTDPSAAARPRWKVRVAFWTGEEIGMWGSIAWFRALSSNARGAIAAYLNLDMIGSPNGVRQVYDWSANGDPPAAPLERLLQRALDLDGVAWENAPAVSSDDLPFGEAGIPTSGLFSGDSMPKSAAQAARFGGTAGVPFDSCYHLACDTLATIDPALLGGLARAAAWTTGYLASGTALAP